MLILIIANSARMLVQAARNLEIETCVIDCCGDQDTQALAHTYRQITTLSLTNLVPVVEFFKQRYEPKYLIYGSGFEKYISSLEYLARQFKILGNYPQTLIALSTSQNFFQQLNYLDIFYPPVRFNQPKKSNCQWLIKPYQGYGGINIHYLSKRYQNKELTSFYYQQYIAGDTLSVLFVANGFQAQIIGFNRQWTVTQNGLSPFCFAGIINNIELSQSHQSTLATWVSQLTAVYQLRGLNGLDFILDKDVCYFLEINCRPPASTQLYTPDLLRVHIRACYGKLSNITYKSMDYKVYEILYAQKDSVISPLMSWPDDCVDIPQVGATIRTGQPLCSMIVTGRQPQELLERLAVKKQLLFEYLHSFNFLT
jgi:predicted ATP-grasp superfamily ATP-dependent carboligase